MLLVSVGVFVGLGDCSCCTLLVSTLFAVAVDCGCCRWR